MDFSRDLICDNLSVTDGVLHFAGQSTAALARQYGTPWLKNTELRYT